MAPGGFCNLLWGHQTLDDQLCTGSGCLVNVEDWDKATTILFEVQETGTSPPAPQPRHPHAHTHTCLESILSSIQEPEWQFTTQTSFVITLLLETLQVFQNSVHFYVFIFLFSSSWEKWNRTYAYEGDSYAWCYKNNTLNIWGHVFWVLLDWKT